MSALILKDVRVTLQGADVLQVPYLELPVRKLVAVVGPNGGGKTMLLRVLSQNIAYSGAVDLPNVCQSWAYMDQASVERKDFPVSVSEYVSMGLYGRYGFARTFCGDGVRSISDVLKRVALEGFESRLLMQLSGGEWQRVQLARLLLLDPDGYILDEPFSAVDRRMANVLQKYLQTLRDRGKSLFVVSHDLHAVKNLFDYVILLRGGVVAAGAPNEVLTAENIERTYGLLDN